MDHSVGILFVHGIGEQKRGENAAAVGRPHSGVCERVDHQVTSLPVVHWRNNPLYLAVKIRKD